MEKEKIESVETAYRKFNLEINAAQKVFDKFGLGSIKKIKRFEQGMVNDVFSLNNEYVLKINTAHPNLPKLEKELSIYKILPKFNVPAPSDVFFDNSQDIIGYPYLIYKQINGNSLDAIWTNLDQEMQDELLMRIGELLGNIHNIQSNDVTLRGQESYSGLKNDISSRVSKISDELLKAKVLNVEIIAKIKNFYLDSMLFDGDSKPSLLHGNYGLGNIIVDKNEVKGIIDWEWASFGHNEEELAVLLYRAYKTDHQKEMFTRGYSKVFAVSSDFNKRYLAYALLYYLKVLPDVPKWTHKPDKQKEYFSETETLIKGLNI